MYNVSILSLVVICEVVILEASSDSENSEGAGDVVYGSRGGP